MNPSLRLLGALTMLALASGGAVATEAKYTCQSGARISAIFSPPDAAHGNVALTFLGSGEKVVLPQVISADGGRYADGRIEFWIKGKGATLTRNGVKDTCTSP